MSSLHYVSRPELRQPSMVVAFSGWPDAGEASSIAMRALVSALDAEKVAEIDCDPFYVFTEARPITSQPEPGERVLIWPTSEFYTWRDPDEERDLVLLQAREPNVRWREYVELVLQVAQDFSVTRMIGLGSNYDAVSHRRPVKLSGRGTTPEISEALSSIGVKETSYQGPSSIQSALLDACRLRGLPAGTMFGHAPHYVQSLPNVQVSYSMLRKLGALLGIRFELDDLSRAATELQSRIEAAVSENDELVTYLQQLESTTAEAESVEAAAEDETPLGEPPSASEVLSELEEFLRDYQERQRQDDKDR
ncbi:MAG TPA: PAC2 family protein [Chloroflexota bacterium]|jgi:proteasome assembly chaperone (PAC2) family protein|nr:PAC2 family protein [Chloroflexota bacterium]